jgi:hypothetical protein
VSGVKAREAEVRKTETPRPKVSLPVAVSLFWHHGAEMDRADAQRMAFNERDENREKENVFARAWHFLDDITNKAADKAFGAVADNVAMGGIFGVGLFAMGVVTLGLYNGLLATTASDASLMVASGVGAAGLIVMGVGLALILLSGYYLNRPRNKPKGRD